MANTDCIRTSDDYMGISVYEQAQHILSPATRVLILFQGSRGGDGIGSALALAHFFARDGRQIDIVGVGTNIVSDQFHFLPGIERIQPTLSPQQKCVISVSVQNRGVKDLSYDIKEDTLRITVTPNHGSIDHHDVHIQQSPFVYDAIITLGVTRLTDLGDTYHNNTTLFSTVPTIAIDHDSTHERYGHINIVSITKHTLAETCLEVCKTIDDVRVTNTVAHALLTGIIAATRSFKSSQMSPETLKTAGELMERGADRAEIVRHLFYTKRVSTLKLWGSILSHLIHDTEYGFVTSSVTRDDLLRSHSTVADAIESVDELITNAPEAKRILLLVEDPKTPHCVHAVLRTTQKHDDALRLLAPFHPKGHTKKAHATLQADLPESEALLLPLLKTNPLL